MNDEDDIARCTISEASARAATAIAASWDNVAHMQDQTSNARSWLRHLLGFASCSDDLLIGMAEERLTLLALALRMADEETT
jgi:hypothetical protein